MELDAKTRARAALAIQKAVSRFLFDPVREINLIDLGFREAAGQEVESEPVIRFHVTERKDENQLEAAGREPLNYLGGIDGFDIEVLTGSYQLHMGGWRPYGPSGGQGGRQRHDPLRGGCSISAETHYGAGTLGGLVHDRASGQPLFLSNWHVLVRNWWARPGQRIYQPGRLDGGGNADTVGLLVRDAMSQDLDAAVARLTGSRNLVNEQIEIGSVTGVTSPALGMQVVKYGRTTRRTEGRITGINGVTRLPYGYIYRTIRNVITIVPRLGGEVSAGGDSGSWWLEQDTRRAVGLHFAGGDQPERALAMEMQPVLDALNVRISG